LGVFSCKISYQKTQNKHTKCLIITTQLLKIILVKVKVKSLSRVWLFVTPWPVAYQTPLSVGFSRQEYWSGLPFPSPNYYDTYQQMALTMILIKSILTSGIWRIWTVIQKIGSRKSIIWWRKESQHCYFFIRL